MPRLTQLLLLLLLPLAALGQDVRVNAGGPSHTDLSGAIWATSNGFTGGTTILYPGTPIDDTSEDILYQSAIEAADGNSFSYNLSVGPGVYRIRLLFAENNTTSKGQNRRFNVLVGGATYVSNLNVFRRAGDLHTAYERSFEVQTLGPTLSVVFSRRNDSPFINAIHITRIDGLAQGTDVPGSCSSGEFFYETDTDKFYICNNAGTFIEKGSAADISTEALFEAEVLDTTDFYSNNDIVACRVTFVTATTAVINSSNCSSVGPVVSLDCYYLDSGTTYLDFTPARATDSSGDQITLSWGLALTGFCKAVMLPATLFSSSSSELSAITCVAPGPLTGTGIEGDALNCGATYEVTRP